MSDPNASGSLVEWLRQQGTSKSGLVSRLRAALGEARANTGPDDGQGGRLPQISKVVLTEDGGVLVEFAEPQDAAGRRLFEVPKGKILNAPREYVVITGQHTPADGEPWPYRLGDLFIDSDPAAPGEELVDEHGTLRTLWEVLPWPQASNLSAILREGTPRGMYEWRGERAGWLLAVEQEEAWHYWCSTREVYINVGEWSPYR